MQSVSASNKSSNDFQTIQSPTSLNYLDLKENASSRVYGGGIVVGGASKFRPVPVRLNFLKFDAYPDRYSHLKASRFESAVDCNSRANPKQTPSRAIESWPKPLNLIPPTTEHQQPVVVSSPVSPSLPPTHTTTSSSALLAEQDTNKQPKPAAVTGTSSRKPKRRNNMRYMTQPVRLIEIQEIQEEDGSSAQQQ